MVLPKILVATDFSKIYSPALDFEQLNNHLYVYLGYERTVTVNISINRSSSCVRSCSS